MTMSVPAKCRSLSYILLAYVALSLSTASADEKPEPSHVCDRVVIDSVKGDVGIWRDKIVRFSRSRGLTGPIIYVDVVAPPPVDGANKIRRISLWWSARSVADAICKAGPDIGQKPAINCAESIPNTQLQLDITFEPESAHGTEMQTDELVKYVSDAVLCKLN